MRAREVSVAGQNGLEQLRGQVEGWRRSPSKSKAMPPELWDAVVKAATQHGPHRVATTLGVNAQRLRQQMVARQATQSGGAMLPTAPVLAPTVQFIDVGTVAEIGPGAAVDPMVVELVAPDGARLTIRTRDAGASVLAMINAFRGRS
jgi:hypothetical protein